MRGSRIRNKKINNLQLYEIHTEQQVNINLNHFSQPITKKCASVEIKGTSRDLTWCIFVAISVAVPANLKQPTVKPRHRQHFLWNERRNNHQPHSR